MLENCTIRFSLWNRFVSFNCLVQNFTVCSTAMWNSTLQIIAGITSSVGATATQLYNPMDVGYDKNGTLYVADSTNNRIQKFINGSNTGVTVPNMTLNNPSAIFVTNDGILYVIDSLNYRVQMWDNDIVRTAAGGHGAGSTLDKMLGSNGLYVDTYFNIYLSDTGNNRVTLWTAGNTTAGQLVHIFIFLF